MFYYTQTAVKDLEKDETCPTRWRAQWLDGIIPFRTNEDMDKGKYFEYLALGSGAIASQQITDLPRLKTGAKSADHIRIEEQAQYFPQVLKDLNLTIVDKQLELKLDNRKGTIDFLADDSEFLWNIDLKLTKDLTSDRTEYGWGNDWGTMDLIQTVHYEKLVQARYPERKIKNALLVFDYSPRKLVEFGEIIVSDTKRAIYEKRFSTAEEVVNKYIAHGWSKIPSQSECKNCILECDKRALKPIVTYKIINY